ncbi:MAG: peroxiredoxin-like family protein [Myxococcota bacterium]
MFCREQVARLTRRYEEIRSMGAEICAIGNGAPPFAQAFREETGVTFPLYVDPERDAYRAFALRRRVTDMLNPHLFLAARRAQKAGFHQTAVRGDALQLGGVFILDASGATHFRHVERFAGDLADFEEIMATLIRLREARPRG